MTKKFIEEVNKWRPQPLPEGDAGVDQLVSDFVLTGPVERQKILDTLDATYDPNSGPRAYGEYRSVATKLKAVHSNLRRVGR